MTAPLRIWAVSDGRAGIEAQALGLAEAVVRLRPAEIDCRRIAWPRWMRRTPTQFIPAWPRLLARGGSALSPPWPDLWIGNGRASVPLSIAVRRWSSGETYVVQLQDPLRPPQVFDLVAPPNHDGLQGPNVFGITGTPHRVTPELLATELAAWRGRLDGLPRPHVAVLIGGRAKAFNLSPARAVQLARQVSEAVRASGGCQLLTFSRRTPPQAEATMRTVLADVPGLIWDGEGSNPYFAFLASADVILVTEDSANMPTEAAATGRPIYLLDMDGAQARKQRFHAELATLGIARRFEGRLESWSYPPLRETDRLAAEVLRRMDERSAARA
ncbi:mitochondrial fission ELM1 family protein [Caulobacter sp. S45]|uniref:mitochondrial fission ELM1 family protein n=1 Tax=Caulobacter sp. S45 TaxID=1641861 RepID=UPI0015759395|nr:mitochondrial fission ELM1 family protein [Caulobacter sp. S45]